MPEAAEPGRLPTGWLGLLAVLRLLSELALLAALGPKAAHRLPDPFRFVVELGLSRVGRRGY